MSEPAKHSKLLPLDDNTVVKLPVGTVIEAFNDIVFDASDSTLYISTKQLNDEVLAPIHNDFHGAELFVQGILVSILEPEKKWVTGKIRLRLAFEFIPDEQEKGSSRSTDAVKGSDQ